MTERTRPRVYFAYGSNMHPLRLGLRTPSARLLGRASLSGFQLRFHTRSDGDGSAKGDAWYTGNKEDTLYGAAYQIDPDELDALDRIEGVGMGHRLLVADVDLAGERQEVFLYVAEHSHIDDRLQPYAWYRDIIWLGAAWHGIPDDYVAAIQAVPAQEDPDAERRELNEALLARFADWLPEHGYRQP